MTILALDLGTKCGYATGDDPHQFVISGVWDLKPGRFDGGGMRFLKFRQRLNDIHHAAKIGRVAFEEVRRHRGTDAAHVYGGLLAILTEWCEEKSIPYEGIPVGTIKSFWTGKGNANKTAMVDEAHRRGFPVIDDNEADAVAILHIAFENIKASA
ncbi:hypothetical protein ATO13_23286 [Stappia sp. 22II-S9-Z10]|nr:hypothetical protein ATO13_23286 [Stappia sp. 22II-S9-Z10]